MSTRQNFVGMLGIRCLTSTALVVHDWPEFRSWARQRQERGAIYSGVDTFLIKVRARAGVRTVSLELGTAFHSPTVLTAPSL